MAQGVNRPLSRKQTKNHQMFQVSLSHRERGRQSETWQSTPALASSEPRARVAGWGGPGWGNGWPFGPVGHGGHDGSVHCQCSPSHTPQIVFSEHGAAIDTGPVAPVGRPWRIEAGPVAIVGQSVAASARDGPKSRFFPIQGFSGEFPEGWFVS